eukprot:s658_g19.t1
MTIVRRRRQSAAQYAIVPWTCMFNCNSSLQGGGLAAAEALLTSSSARTYHELLVSNSYYSPRIESLRSLERTDRPAETLRKALRAANTSGLDLQLRSGSAGVAVLYGAVSVPGLLSLAPLLREAAAQLLWRISDGMWFSDFNCCSFHDTFQEASPEPIGYPSGRESYESYEYPALVLTSALGAVLFPWLLEACRSGAAPGLAGAGVPCLLLVVSKRIFLYVLAFWGVFVAARRSVLLPASLGERLVTLTAELLGLGPELPPELRSRSGEGMNRRYGP